MTLAALSPLYTWWLLFFALLAVIYKVVSPAVVRRQERPWPPPVVLQLAPPVYANWPPPHVMDGVLLTRIPFIPAFMTVEP